MATSTSREARAAAVNATGPQVYMTQMQSRIVLADPSELDAVRVRWHETFRAPPMYRLQVLLALKLTLGMRSDNLTVPPRGLSHADQLLDLMASRAMRDFVVGHQARLNGRDVGEQR